VLSVDLSKVELIEEISELDSRNSIRFSYALSSTEGTASTAVVYFELDPGKRLSRHTDSAEEVLIVLEGTAEATVGDERAMLAAGGVLVVPAMNAHEVTNVGPGLVRAVGFFSSSTVVSTFEEPVVTGGDQVFVAGAPLPLASPLGEPQA
jgi:quercetin dioxygenase-like cupin family protein